MGSPLLKLNKLLLDSADLGTDQTTETLDLSTCHQFAFQLVWSGGSGTNGNFRVEATNDLINSEPNPTYSLVYSVPITTTSGTALLPGVFAMYNYVRFVWSRSAGTGGIITARATLKLTTND